MKQPLDDYLALCQAIGHIVVNWALLETQLENWVNVSFRDCGGKGILNTVGRIKHKDVPRAFSRKVAFLYDCFEVLPKLAPYKERGISILDRAVPISLLRNDLVHGTIENLIPTDRIFKFWVRDREKNSYSVRLFEFRADEFPDLEKSLSDLVTEAAVVASQMIEFFPTRQQ